MLYVVQTVFYYGVVMAVVKRRPYLWMYAIIVRMGSMWRRLMTLGMRVITCWWGGGDNNMCEIATYAHIIAVKSWIEIGKLEIGGWQSLGD